MTRFLHIARWRSRLPSEGAFIDALKEIGISMERVPSNRGGRN